MTFRSVNPTNDEVIANYESMSSDEMRTAIDDSFDAWQDWRRLPFSERAGFMRQAAAVLRDHKDEFAYLITDEMGKPVHQAQGEIDKCAWACEFYADNAERFLAPYQVETDVYKSFVTYQPLGPVFAIMPWNFPFWQVFRFAAPTLMAGNTGLLKHAPNVGGCAQAIEQVFREAGFPDNVFRNLFIDTDQSAAAIENPKVRAVTLTGSPGAGSAVAAKAGEMLKKSVLELGGSDPYIILEDADLDEAITACATSRLMNSGQSCIGAKRFIVVESLRERFEQGMVDRMGAAKVGDPRAADTEVGPMARHDLRDKLHDQVRQSMDKGARCLLGGSPHDGVGCFYMPTVLTDVAPGMPAYDEEMFGPVASIIGVRDEAEALRVANDTQYGLGSGLFTRDLERAERIASEEIEAGATFVNSFVASDPRLPFGGIKNSGYGRELSDHGIREFVNIKSVSIK